MLKVAYTRIHLQQYERALHLRMAALPVIRSRETALRIEINRRIQILEKERTALLAHQQWMSEYAGLWLEAPIPLFQGVQIEKRTTRFAGVEIPEFSSITVVIEQETDDNSTKSELGFPNQNLVWYAELKQDAQVWLQLETRVRLQEEAIQRLVRERRRATQKLNLFEKIQIPELESAIKGVRRFLEDEENLVKATLKRVKSRRIAE